MRISQGIHSLCGQQPHSPRKCSWALIKTWVPREAEMFCLFVKPQLYFLGLLSGWVSSQCLSSVLPSEESWSHPLFPGQKSNRNHISDITLSTKVCLVKTMVFPVVTYGCESWAIKKAECQRIDAFELWCWRRLLRVPWTARRLDLQPVHSEGDQPWDFFGRNDAKAETPVLWPPHAKS